MTTLIRWVPAIAHGQRMDKFGCTEHPGFAAQERGIRRLLRGTHGRSGDEVNAHYEAFMRQEQRKAVLQLDATLRGGAPV